MTSRFHVLTLDLSLPSLDFCRQSCVVVFSGGRGAIDLEISRRKKREKSSSRENSQKKGLLISNKKKKKARKEVVKAPPQVRSKPWRPPVPPLPSRIPSQVNPYIHVFLAA